MLRFKALKPVDAQNVSWASEPLSALLPAQDGAYIPDAVAAGDTLIAIFEDDAPIGVVHLDRQPIEGKPRCIRVHTIVLLPQYRRHGLGRMLMGLAADAAAEQGIWFLAGNVPDTPAAQGFASAIHMKPTAWYDDLYLLDLSDVDGLRHG